MDDVQREGSISLVGRTLSAGVVVFLLENWSTAVVDEVAHMRFGGLFNYRGTAVHGTDIVRGSPPPHSRPVDAFEQ